MADEAHRVYGLGDAVEARFTCNRKDVLDQSSVSINLGACITGADNKDWAPYTPAGSILMTVTGGAAAVFEQGARYRVLIQRVADGE